MAWVIDTCLLIDVLENDPKFGAISARLIDSKRKEGLLLCPVTYIELSPAFGGDFTLQQEFLEGVGIDWLEPWTWQDTETSHQIWNSCISKKRQNRAARRPIADILIGSFALRFNGLLTRNTADFRSILPYLHLVHP